MYEGQATGVRTDPVHLFNQRKELKLAELSPGRLGRVNQDGKCGIGRKECGYYRRAAGLGSQRRRRSDHNHRGCN